MARDEYIEARLRRWAEWRKVGDASGYAAVNVLHPNWSPPSPGVRPGMRVSTPTDAPATERAVRRLSARLQATLDLHYCRNLSLADQAERLLCAPSTVIARIHVAHRQLAAMLAANLTIPP